jgi:hypothetical protein
MTPAAGIPMPGPSEPLLVGPNRRFQIDGRTRAEENCGAMRGSFDSQSLVQHPRQALPAGRALRLLLGLAVTVYVAPV